MASAALNSGVMESLVVRGSAPPTSREDPSQPSSPMSSGGVHPQAYLHAHFPGITTGHYGSGGSGDPHDLSNSGDTTTEDDEFSPGDPLGPTTGEDPGPAAGKKRRKQSRPVRLPSPNVASGNISGNPEDQPNTHDSSKDQGHHQDRLQDHHQQQHLNHISEQLTNHQSRHKDNAPFDSSEVSNTSADGDEGACTCPHCGLNVSSATELRHHIIEEHIGRLLSEDEMLPAQQNHPGDEAAPLNLSSLRWNPHLPSRSQEEDGRSCSRSRSPPTSIPMPPSFRDMKLGLPGLLPLAPPPFLLPFLQQAEHERLSAGIQRQQGSPNSLGPSGSQQNRIFNQEAYCDLCNKEFCNKYFLKTHKANKHGIYSPDISSSPPGIPGANAPLPPPLTSPLPSPLAPAFGGSPYAGAFIAANMTNLPLRPFLPALHSPIKAIPLPKTEAGGSSSSSSNSGGVGKGVSSSGIINVEAYCELCQKEFCNKYFLKRHKSKIHGITIDVVTKPKAPGIPPPRLAPDRPDGWCDACRRDIGGRAAINAHKLQAHGPHVAPLPSARSPAPHPAAPQAARTPTPKDGRRDQLEHHREYFNPWDVFRDPREAAPRETWEVNELERRTPARSPWDRPLGSPWDARPDVTLRESPKESGVARTAAWGSLDPRTASLPPQLFSRHPDQHDFPLDPRDLQAARQHEEKQREWQSQYQHHRDQEEGDQEARKQERSQDPYKEHKEQQRGVDHYEKQQQHERENMEEVKEREAIIEMREKAMSEIKMELPYSEDNQRKEDREELKKVDASGMKEETAEESKQECGERVRERLEMGPEAQSEGEIVREVRQEEQRTPGSSADESSRDTGIIARVGQPAIVQAPPGTKFTPEQLRQLGVINPDAFCELCCKEFCNKYFLRTHRIKKHGIYTPEFSERSKPIPKESSNGKGSPLSLVRILERQQGLDHHRPPLLPDLDGEVECELCHRPFPNPYLLQVHRYCCRGPAPPHNPLSVHPSPHPHEQLRHLALQAQQQMQQQARHHHQQQQKRLQEQHRRLQQEQQQHYQQQQQQLQQHQLREEQQREECQREEREREERQREERQREEQKQQQQQEEEQQESLREARDQEGGQENESDASEDLRKLQSMILQLNRQGEAGGRCRVCSRDLPNKYFLRAHMMTEHGLLGGESISTPPPSEAAHAPRTPKEILFPGKVSPPPTPTAGESQAFCSVCKKDFFSRYILQQHLLSAHGIFTPPVQPTSFMDRIRAEVEGREDRKPQSTSRSYCEICNKELCNKYFMKTHMLKMHGINVENGITGGVTCEICNKELCSKYFLRVHKQNTHGLVEEGREAELEAGERAEIESCPMCPFRFKNRKWLKTHLTSDHGQAGKDTWRQIEVQGGGVIGPEAGAEAGRDTSPLRLPPQVHYHEKQGQKCGLCGVVVGDVVSLQLHMIKTHGSLDNADASTLSDRTTPQGLKCPLCSFTAPTTALLYAHARTHASGMTSMLEPLQCPLCPQLLSSLEAFHQHLLHHQLSGLLHPLLRHVPTHSALLDPTHASQRQAEAEAETEGDNEVGLRAKRQKKRWRCSCCNRRFRSRSLCLAHVHAVHNPRARGTWLGRPVAQRRIYKCRKCGVVAPKLAALRQHIRDQHKARAIPGLPTTHATPTPSPAHRFVMQPFLLNDQGSEGAGEGEDGAQQGGCQFVSSLVYLPVARRVQRPLTVSFSLTPA